MNGRRKKRDRAWANEMANEYGAEFSIPLFERRQELQRQHIHGAKLRRMFDHIKDALLAKLRGDDA